MFFIHFVYILVYIVLFHLFIIFNRRFILLFHLILSFHRIVLICSHSISYSIYKWIPTHLALLLLLVTKYVFHNPLDNVSFALDIFLSLHDSPHFAFLFCSITPTSSHLITLPLLFTSYQHNTLLFVVFSQKKNTHRIPSLVSSLQVLVNVIK